MPHKIAVTHPKTGRTIHVPPEQLPGLKAAGWGDTTPDQPGGEIPDKASDVVAWIGDNPTRAAQALEVEQARAKPRKTVLEHAHSLTGDNQPDEGLEDDVDEPVDPPTDTTDIPGTESQED